MIPSQMLKGTLEGCVLKIISEKETYGYEISVELKKCGFGTISEGTIYPMLLRLEKRGLLQVMYKESSLGPKRKYFSLTSEGELELENFYKNFKAMEEAVERLFLDGKEHVR